MSPKRPFETVAMVPRKKSPVRIRFVTSAMTKATTSLAQAAYTYLRLQENVRYKGPTQETNFETTSSRGESSQKRACKNPGF